MASQHLFSLCDLHDQYAFYGIILSVLNGLGLGPDLFLHCYWLSHMKTRAKA